MRGRHPSSFLPRHRGFILLEVLVAMVLVAIALVGLMRAFVSALDTVGRIQLTERAMLLARTVMDDLVIEPPAEGDYTVDFSEDIRFGEAFEGWTMELKVEAEEPDYRDRPPGKMLRDLEELYVIEQLSIFYEDRRGKREVLRLASFMIEPDLFTQQAMQVNQLF